MWPWEHLAVGYLAYSLWCRAVGRRGPQSDETLLLGFATQFPDLVDKPLGWSTTVLPDGTSLAHSLLVAVPLATLVLLVTRRYGRPGLGIAFALGYLLHLPADVVYPVLFGGQLNPEILLWPLIPSPPEPTVSLFGRTAELVALLLERLSTPAGFRYVVLEVLLLVTALVAWISDGVPGLTLLSPATWRRR